MNATTYCDRHINMLFLSTAGLSMSTKHPALFGLVTVAFLTDQQFLTEGKGQPYQLVVLMDTSTVACSTCTCGDMRVYSEGIVGWVNASLLVVLLAEGECASIHADIVDVCIASHRGLW